MSRTSSTVRAGSGGVTSHHARYSDAAGSDVVQTAFVNEHDTVLTVVAETRSQRGEVSSVQRTATSWVTGDRSAQEVLTAFLARCSSHRRARRRALLESALKMALMLMAGAVLITMLLLLLGSDARTALVPLITGLFLVAVLGGVFLLMLPAVLGPVRLPTTSEEAVVVDLSFRKLLSFFAVTTTTGVRTAASGQEGDDDRSEEFRRSVVKHFSQADVPLYDSVVVQASGGSIIIDAPLSDRGRLAARLCLERIVADRSEADEALREERSREQRERAAEHARARAAREAADAEGIRLIIEDQLSKTDPAARPSTRRATAVPQPTNAPTDEDAA